MRPIISAALLLSLGRPCSALAQGGLLRTWIEPRSSKVVMGQFAGGAPAPLFDVSVRTKDAFAAGASWRFSRFEEVSLSPDGRRVAFKAAGANSTLVGIFRVDSRDAQILDTSGAALTFTWSPAGRYLVVQDSQGLVNNTLRVMAYDDLLSEMEISGDVLSDLGYNAYRFRNEGIDGGANVWRTEVFAPKWTSERALSFKIRRVHLVHGKEPPPSQSGEPAVELWSFDVLSKRFEKL